MFVVKMLAKCFCYVVCAKMDITRILVKSFCFVLFCEKVDITRIKE